MNAKHLVYQYNAGRYTLHELLPAFTSLVTHDNVNHTMPLLPIECIAALREWIADYPADGLVWIGGTMSSERQATMHRSIISSIPVIQEWLKTNRDD